MEVIHQNGVVVEKHLQVQQVVGGGQTHINVVAVKHEPHIVMAVYYQLQSPDIVMDVKPKPHIVVVVKTLVVVQTGTILYVLGDIVITKLVQAIKKNIVQGINLTIMSVQAIKKNIVQAIHQVIVTTVVLIKVVGVAVKKHLKVQQVVNLK